MNASTLDKKALRTFLVITFGVAWILFSLPLAFRNQSAATHQNVMLASFSLAMWAPAIGALVATKQADGSFQALRLLNPGTKRYYLWAWFLFPVLSALTGLLTVLFRVAKFDPEFSLITQALATQSQSVTLAPGLLVLAQIIAAVIFAPLLNAIFAFGEELGWRGFLLPKLMPLGERKAIIISNVIWGFWHAPAIVQGHNYPGHPILGIFMMVVFTVLAGTILSWLYLKTHSPWVPALGHGSINAVASLSLLFLVPGFDIAIGGTLASVVGWIPLAGFVFWLVQSKRVAVSE